MEVFFCDRCSARVTEGDLAEGRAFQIHTFVLCKACWDNSEVREAIERRIAEASGVMPVPQAVKQQAGSGRRPGRRKTPRPASGRRRTPARGTPRRTPLPQGRRRTPGRTSPVSLERVPHGQGHRHDAMSRRRPEAPAASNLPKLIALAIIGLCLGVMAVLFLGGKKDPDTKPPRKNTPRETSETGTNADLTEAAVSSGTDAAAVTSAVGESDGTSLQPVPGPGVMGALRSRRGFEPEYGPGVGSSRSPGNVDVTESSRTTVAIGNGRTGTGLTAHWRLDDAKGAAIAADATGNGNGSVSDPGNMPGHDGRIGGAYRFGGDDRIETPMPGPHNMHLTWSAWIKTTKGGALLANTGETWAEGGRSLFVRDGTLKLDVGWVGLVDTGFKVDDGVWHHVALTVVDSGANNDRVAIYVDGVERKRIEGFDFYRIDGSSLTMRIGHCPEMGGYFDGYIDDVRIYGHALSAAEVQALYRLEPDAPGSRDDVKTSPVTGAPGGGRETGLVAHWKFDETPGAATSADATGRHNGRISDSRSMVGHAGRFGRAYRFVARDKDDHVDAGAPLLKSAGAYTLAGWISPSSVPQPGKPGLWGQDDNCEFGFWGGDIVWWTANGNDRVTVAYPYAANQWHHIAIVAKRGMKRVYFDGQEYVWNEGFDGACDDGNHNFKIGGGGIWDEATPGWFDGMIDDVRIYNRALTPAEVKAIFTGEVESKPEKKGGAQ